MNTSPCRTISCAGEVAPLLADRMETLSETKEGELTKLRTELRAAQATVKPNVAPKKVVVDDTEAAKKPVKKSPLPRSPNPPLPQPQRIRTRLSIAAATTALNRQAQMVFRDTRHWAPTRTSDLAAIL